MPYNFQSGPNFGSGLAEGASDAISDIRKSKLALQMMNTKIQAESQARMAEQQQAATIKTLAPEEMAGLQKLYNNLGKSAVNGGEPEYDLSVFKSAESQFYANKMMGEYIANRAKTSKMEAYQTPWYSDVTGQRIGYKSFNQYGNPVAQKQDPGGADKEKSAIALLNGMQGLNSLDAAEKGIDFGRVSGMFASGQAILGLDDGNMAKFKAYKNLVSSMATPLVTGSHRFAPAEQAQLQNSLGTAFNTPQEVRAAAGAIRSIDQTGISTLGVGEDPTWASKYQARLGHLNQQSSVGAAPVPGAQAPAPRGLAISPEQYEAQQSQQQQGQ